MNGQLSSMEASKYISKYQLDRLKNFKTRYTKAFSQVRQPMISCNTSMVSGRAGSSNPANARQAPPMTNNYMADGQATFGNGGSPVKDDRVGRG